MANCKVYNFLSTFTSRFNHRETGKFILNAPIIVNPVFDSTNFNQINKNTL